MSTGLFRTNLRQSVTCPHCWKRFAPEDSLWISNHPDLLGDIVLGELEQQRFLPSRFDVQGNALDPKNVVCQDLACPYCHLKVPRSLLELIPFFVSIAGTPACGKSYFLASMTWQMRQTMPKHFAASFADADTTSNQILNANEEQQFFNPNQEQIVKLEKTEEQGDLYSDVHVDGQTVTYPRPFLFSIRPNEHHANIENSEKVSRLMCLYDNAGESFLPGKDTLRNPVTRHLSVSKCMLFCFDPTQDPRFRKGIGKESNDFQVTDSPVTARQETVFHEITTRIRKHRGIEESTRTNQLLLVLCTKFDAWSSMMGVERLETPWSTIKDRNMCALDMKTITEVSKQVREVLWKYSSELVSAAEGFSDNVYYIPVSATGCAPVKDPETGYHGIRPMDIDPMWCEVPMLVALAKNAAGLVAYKS